MVWTLFWICVSFLGNTAWASGPALDHSGNSLQGSHGRSEHVDPVKLSFDELVDAVGFQPAKWNAADRKRLLTLLRTFYSNRSDGTDKERGAFFAAASALVQGQFPETIPDLYFEGKPDRTVHRRNNQVLAAMRAVESGCEDGAYALNGIYSSQFHVPAPPPAAPRPAPTPLEEAEGPPELTTASTGVVGLNAAAPTKTPAPSVFDVLQTRGPGEKSLLAILLDKNNPLRAGAEKCLSKKAEQLLKRISDVRLISAEKQKSLTIAAKDFLLKDWGGSSSPADRADWHAAYKSLMDEALAAGLEASARFRPFYDQILFDDYRMATDPMVRLLANHLQISPESASDLGEKHLKPGSPAANIIGDLLTIASPEKIAEKIEDIRREALALHATGRIKDKDVNNIMGAAARLDALASVIDTSPKASRKLFEPLAQALKIAPANAQIIAERLVKDADTSLLASHFKNLSSKEQDDALTHLSTYLARKTSQGKISLGEVAALTHAIDEVSDGDKRGKYYAPTDAMQSIALSAWNKRRDPSLDPLKDIKEAVAWQNSKGEAKLPKALQLPKLTLNGLKNSLIQKSDQTPRFTGTDDKRNPLKSVWVGNLSDTELLSAASALGDEKTAHSAMLINSVRGPNSEGYYVLMSEEHLNDLDGVAGGKYGNQFMVYVGNTKEDFESALKAMKNFSYSNQELPNLNGFSRLKYGSPPLNEEGYPEDRPILFLKPTRDWSGKLNLKPYKPDSSDESYIRRKLPTLVRGAAC